MASYIRGYKSHQDAPETAQVYTQILNSPIIDLAPSLFFFFFFFKVAGFYCPSAMSYEVYTAEYIGQPNHVAIYIETQPSTNEQTRNGLMYHVV